MNANKKSVDWCVCKTLNGLVDVMEGLPDTADNVDLWQAIGEASQTAIRITKEIN